jgi:hypothetical protein
MISYAKDLRFSFGCQSFNTCYRNFKNSMHDQIDKIYIFAKTKASFRLSTLNLVVSWLLEILFELVHQILDCVIKQTGKPHSYRICENKKFPLEKYISPIPNISPLKIIKIPPALSLSILISIDLTWMSNCNEFWPN